MTHRIALVGIGKIARDQHVHALAASGDFALVATASHEGRVEEVEAYPDLAALLAAREDVTCVSLCTPPMARYDDARRALEAGRHVMLEKPPGATLSEVEALRALAAERGLSLFATWHSREAAAVTAAQGWMAGRRLRRAEVIWKEDVRRWHPGQEWIWQAGGLGVFDPGINALSVLTAVLPGPLHIEAAELAFPANRDTPIAADLRFRAGGGAEVTAVFDWRQEGPQTWDILLETDTGTAVLSDGGARLRIDGAERGTEAEAADREYPRLYARFADLLSRGASDVDLAPLRHVADAFMLGRRAVVDRFDW